MIQLPDTGNRPPVTPQLALRVAILGGMAFVLFAVIFFRLWYLQVLSGDQYVAEARNNQVRNIVVPAPRGDIVDRNGNTLVTSRVATVVQIDPSRLPPRGPRRDRLFEELGRVLDTPSREIRAQIVRQRRQVPYANPTLDVDVPLDAIAFFSEHRERFPGVTVEKRYLREYPYRRIAAQLFGTVGEVSEEQLEEDETFEGVRQGTVVGQSGIEYSYDRYLRGVDGAARVRVDSLGRPRGELSRKLPRAGQQLKLTLDLELQRAGQKAMRLAGAGTGEGRLARAGGFVALDPRNGEVLAMGSVPSFDPNVFSRPLTQRQFERIQDAPGAPLYNRALAEYPTGSTFKVITALAGLDAGLVTPETVINDPGFLRVGAQTFTNAGETPYGSVDLRRALTVSSDVYFYKLGQRANPIDGMPIQAWSRRLGLDRPTGIDIPGEPSGNVPDPEWRAERARMIERCARANRRRDSEDREDCSVYGDGRPWSVGDNINLSVGQGDLQASPLQMAVVYAAIANGGRVVRPHLGLQVEDGDGGVVQRVERRNARRAEIEPSWLEAIRDGLRAAASAPGGTSTDVFRGFPYPVYGKTGTAERQPYLDQSWYVGYVPHASRPIVVAATVENGGFGAEAAAPVVRYMLSEWFDVRQRFVAGDSRTN